MTAEELMARVEQADARIDEGHYVEHEAAKQHFQSRIAKKTIKTIDYSLQRCGL